MDEEQAMIETQVASASKVPDGVLSNYKRTAVGIIPEDWTAVRMGQLAHIVRGASPRPIDSPKWFDEQSTTGWLRIADVSATEKYLDTTSQSLSQAGISHSRLVNRGSLVMSICATVGKPIITRKDVCIHDGFVVFSNLTLDKEYLYYVLQDLENDWSRHGQTGSQMNLNTGLINSTPVPLPSPTEQRAIASVLSDVDKLIGALDALIAKKRAIKQAAMQQLLTGKTRLPGFAGKWEVLNLGAFVRIRNRKISPVDAGGETPCVELEHIGQGDGRLSSHGTAGRTSSIKHLFEPGDILFGRLRPYLRKWWYADHRGVCSTEIWPLVVDQGRADTGFVYALVQTDRFLDAAEASYGTHMPRADWNIVATVEFQLPPVSEQRAIATVLSDMDAEIAALERRLDKTRAVKQGMMQQLLTGSIRLPVLDDSRDGDTHGT